MTERGHQRNFDNLIAGAVAGGLEAGITYPTEYVKTRQQLATNSGHTVSPFQLLRTTLRQPNAVATFYGGATPFVVSNAAKSAVRFFTFDTIRRWLPRDRETERPLASSNFVAGLMAGVAESIIVVTPGETLKTKIIDDKRRPGGPQFRGSVDAIQKIVVREGLPGLYKGVIPVTLKQSSNAMVRFTSYNLISERLDSVMAGNLESLKPVLAGASAGVVTVYCSQPFDTIKTRLQSLTVGHTAQGTLSCAVSLVREDGIKALWRGTSPRLVRLTISGMISFTVYEYTLELMGLWRRQSSMVGDQPAVL